MTAAGSPVTPVALVTGGSRGIGRGLVRAFAQEGWDVAFSYRENVDAARSVASEVEARGRRVAFQASDAAEPAEGSRFVAFAIERLGRVDAVVTNAGISGWVPWEQLTPEDWTRLFRVHVLGPYETIRAAAPELRRRRGSATVISSLSALTAFPENLHYAAVKAAANSLVLSLALALAPEVRVNSVAPGYVRTDMNRGIYDDPQIRRRIESRIPRGRWGRPEDVAAAVLFLASAGARFITGQTVVLDGGNRLSLRAATIG